MQAKKLNQVLAVEKAIRSKREDDFTRAYQDVQKESLFTGFLRTYTPKLEDGDKLPLEQTKVKLRVEDAVSMVRQALRELCTITAVRDATNMTAKASIVVDGKVLVADVPAVHLLFLEKRLPGILDFIEKLPVLNTDASWRRNEGLGLYETDPTESFRTKKVEDFRIIVQATKEHPAQTVRVVEDVVVGTWKSVVFSGAIPVLRRDQLRERAEKLQQAVKIAREEANQAPVAEFSSAAVFDYILAP